MKFQKYLKYLIDAGEYRLVDLADSTKMHSSDLSKIINAKRKCGQRAMVQILPGLNEVHQAASLSAWLVDQIPPEYRHLVHVVQSASSVVKEEAPDINTLEGALQVLRKQAESNDSLMKLLTNIAEAFAKK